MKIITYLNALYIGLNQQRYENGVNNKKYKMDRPNVAPSPNAISNANPPRMFNNSIKAWTVK